MKIPQFIILTLIIIALVGFADSSYLAWKHYSNVSVTCRVFEGCDRVLASAYATIGNTPVALFGVIYYGFLLYLLAVYLVYKNPMFLKSFAVFSIVGFLASLWLLYLQIFVIKAFCFYCLISAATATSLFILSMFLLFKYKSTPQLIKLWKTK